MKIVRLDGEGIVLSYSFLPRRAKVALSICTTLLIVISTFIFGKSDLGAFKAWEKWGMDLLIVFIFAVPTIWWISCSTFLYVITPEKCTTYSVLYRRIRIKLTETTLSDILAVQKVEEPISHSILVYSRMGSRCEFWGFSSDQQTDDVFQGLRNFLEIWEPDFEYREADWKHREQEESTFRESNAGRFVGWVEKNEPIIVKGLFLVLAVLMLQRWPKVEEGDVWQHFEFTATILLLCLLFMMEKRFIVFIRKRRNRMYTSDGPLPFLILGGVLLIAFSLDFFSYREVKDQEAMRQRMRPFKITPDISRGIEAARILLKKRSEDGSTLPTPKPEE
jgi:hypothetical protein